MNAFRFSHTVVLGFAVACALLAVIGWLWRDALLATLVRNDRTKTMASNTDAAYQWIAAQLPSEMPHFQLPDAYGNVHSSADWLGDVVVVNVWATWCEPCRWEVPLLIAAQEKWSEHGLQVVGLALDEPADVQVFEAAMGINYVSLIVGSEARSVLDAFGSSALGIPHTLVFDRTGERVGFHLGMLTAEELEALLGIWIKDTLHKTP